MSKIIICADVHIGVSNKVDDSLWALDAIYHYAIKQGISKILILGDLFHDRVSLRLDIISKTFEFFSKATEVDWVCFCGNHDQYFRNSWEYSSIGHLRNTINIIDEVKLLKIYGQRFWILPFIHYEQAYMNVLAKIEEKYEEGDILLTHIGVKNSKLNECFLLKSWNFVEFTNSKFKKVYTGHFHSPQQVGENVWYPGSPIPFRFDEGMVDHGFFVFDVKTQKHEYVNLMNIAHNGYTPPDYITVLDTDLPEVDPSNAHVRVSLNRDYSGNELITIRKRLIDNGAKNVVWLKPKQNIINEQSVVVDVNNSQSYFDRWIEKDNPQDLNIKLLKKINEEILQEVSNITD